MMQGLKQGLFLNLKRIDMKILFLLLIAFNCTAQDSSYHYKLFSKQNRASYILSAVAGLSDGVSDANFFHHAFRGSQYADFYLSWRNKYKNGDPAQGERFFGSTTFLVWTTDLYHLSNTVRDLSQSFSVAVSFQDLKDIKHKWKFILLKAGINYGSNRVGHFITYDVIFKQ